MANLDDMMDADSWAKASDQLLKQNTAAQVNNSLYNAATVNSDQAAGDTRVAKILNIPVQSVSAYRDDATKQAKVQTLDSDALVSKSPVLARFLTVQQNANIMHPDIQPAHDIEQTISNWNPSIGERISEWTRNAFGVTAQDQARAMNAYAEKGTGVTPDEARQTFGGMSDVPMQVAGKALNMGSFGLIPDVAGPPTSTAGSIAGGIGSLGGFMLGGPVKATEYLGSKIGSTALTHVAGESFAKALAKDVTAQAATLGTATALSTAGGALDSPDLGAAASKEGSAAVSGAGMGAVFGSMGRILPSNTIAQTLGRIVGGSAALDAQGGTNPMDDRPLEQKVFDYGLNALFLAKGAGKVDGGWFHAAAKADMATEDQSKFTALSQAAGATKFRETAPDLFHNMVSDMSDSSDFKNVYVNGKTFADTLQQSGITPEELTQKLPDVAKQLVEAQETNGDVRISTADYATHIAPTDLGKALLPHLKTDPDAMTYQDAQAFYQSQGEELKAQAEKLVSDNQNDAEYQADHQQVYDKVLDQLNQTNRFPNDVNKQYATLARDHYITRADQLGVKPSELYERYPLNVDSTFKDGDRLNQSPIGKALADRIANDPEGAKQEYANLPDTDNGRILNTDQARELSPEYRADRTRSAEVHEASSKFVKDMYTEKLSQPVAKGRSPIVLFTAGGTGAGKSSALETEAGKKLTQHADIIYDTNMNTLGSAVGKIDQALASGRDVAIKYVYRDPVEALVNGALPRAERMGRTVPLNAHADTHVGASKVIRELQEKYKDDPRVDITGVDNTHGKGNAKEVSIDHLPLVEDNTNLRSKLNEALDTEHRAGNISNAVYHGTQEQYAKLQRNIEANDARDGGQPEPGNSQPPRLNQAERGSYTPESNTISLLKDADLSTFVHELGHHFLEMTADLAKQPDAPAAITSDFNKILNWFGVKDATAWDALSFEDKREYHEQFARGFESYLFEGKAPNLELQPVFARVRAWLTHVYQSLTSLNVKLTPEVRGVFDRMLASEKTIKEAEAARVFEPLFTEKPEGMSDTDWQDYKDLGQQATQDAVSDLESKSLRDMKWLSNAKSRILKDLQKEAKATRDRVMGEVQEQVYNSPTHKAQEMMEANPKLDKEVVAEVHGFKSAKEMTQAITDAGNDRTQIEALTDTRMLQEHGELTSPRAIDEAASAAIHNEARARFMATGLKILAKSPIPAKLLLKGAKEAAASAIEAKKVGDINPRQYEAAEARANKEAIKLAPKEPAEAAMAQRAALLNNQLAKAARDAQTEIQKTVDYFKKLGKESIRSKIDVDIREQIDNLLERFDFRQKPTDGPTKQQVQLQQWVDSQKALGYTPMEHPDIMNPEIRTPYKNMSMDQLRGLRDTVKSLETIGRERRTITVDGVKQDVKDYVQNQLIPKMIERGEKFTNAQIADRPRKGVDPMWRVTLDRLSSWLRAGFSEFTRPDYKANKYDLHELMGPFQKSISERLIGASYKFGDSMDQIGMLKKQRMIDYGLDKEWQKSLDDIMSGHNLMDNSLAEPIQRRLTRGDFIGIALHVGNESNFDKLVKGMGWKPEDVWQALHDNMGHKDWNAAKTMGEMAGAKWDEMADMNRRLGNDTPAKIEPRPFPTKYGDMPGWYSPIDYDPIRSRLGARKAEANAVNPTEGLFGRDYYRADTTTNGSLNARSTGYYDFINLDWRPVEKRISDTLRDLAFREALIDVHKIYSNKDFRGQFQRSYGPEEYTHMGDWLGRLVNAEIGDEGQSKLAAIMASSRRALVANGVAFRISTMLKHGGSAGAKSAGFLAGGGKKYFAKRIAQMVTNYKNEVADALAKFPEIRQRLRQQDRDFSRAVTAIFEPESIHGKAERYGHAGVAWLDFFTAVPTAHAAYDWATTEGIPKRLGGTGQPMSEADAIKFASKMVREAHGSTNEASRSLLINNKSELVKTLTTLHGFMNNAFGQNADALDKLLHAKGFGKPELLARTMMAQIVPGIMAGYITFGGPTDKETWLGWAFHHIGGEFAGMVPMVRDAWSLAADGHESAGSMPWVRALSDVHKLVKDAGQGSEAKHPIKDAGNVAGLLLPGLGQGGTTSQYLYDAAKGNQPHETVSQWLRGIMSGKAEASR